MEHVTDNCCTTLARPLQLQDERLMASFFLLDAYIKYCVLKFYLTLDLLAFIKISRRESHDDCQQSMFGLLATMNAMLRATNQFHEVFWSRIEFTQGLLADEGV